MQNECTAYSVIEKHPEIKYAILEWTWPFWAQYIEGNAIMEAEGTRYDGEYTFYGPREHVLGFLARYDCWDGIISDIAITENCSLGVLRIRHDGEIYDRSYLTDVLPNICEIATVSKRMLRTIDMPMTDNEWCFMDIDP